MNDSPVGVCPISFNSGISEVFIIRPSLSVPTAINHAGVRVEGERLGEQGGFVLGGRNPRIEQHGLGNCALDFIASYLKSACLVFSFLYFLTAAIIF